MFVISGWARGAQMRVSRVSGNGFILKTAALLTLMCCFQSAAFGAKDSFFDGVFRLSNIDGSNGFVINGVAAGDSSGGSVAYAGDINDDGLDDLMIGARHVDANGTNSGASYVVFGGAGVGSAGSLELSALNGSNGFTVNGIAAQDVSGSRVRGAGDVNDDGVDDVMIGSIGVDPNGQSYVVFGGASVGASGAVELSALDGSNGFFINGIEWNDHAGEKIDGAGDINDDGVDDLVIGAYGADPNGIGSGESYVIFGGSGVGAGGAFELSSLNGGNGFVLNGIEQGDLSGLAVSRGGDINNDGIDDLIIGAHGGGPNNGGNGETYVVFGGAGVGATGTFELSSLDGSNGFAINGGDSSRSSGLYVSNAGDVNGDGADDLIIGVRAGGAGAGDEAYVVFGGADVGTTGAVELGSLDGSDGFVINGREGVWIVGGPVSNAGDINDDGFDDVIVGIEFEDAFYNEPGEAYVIFGGEDMGASGSVDVVDLDGENGFVIKGINVADIVGGAISFAGDINDDGIDDLLLGARGGDPNGSGSGQTYVVFGVPEPATSGMLGLGGLWLLRRRR